MIGTGTYSPEDNKLRLYPFARLDKEVYERVRAAGFVWAPKQELFVAPMWTPERADLLDELCGEIGDEDTSLVECAEERAWRFDKYSDNRRTDAKEAQAAVAAIADNIPLGQPILVGHHSERHARKDAERIENGMRRAIKMWDTAQYWQRRAAGALSHAKYKELPSVRSRRIKAIEAARRKQLRVCEHARKFTNEWNREGMTQGRAAAIANYDGGYWSPSFEFKRENGEVYHVGPCSLWDAVARQGVPFEEVRAKALQNHAAAIAHADRWIQHYDNRIAYERAMLGEVGGTVADRTRPEKGGACKCWATKRGESNWSTIQKVNKVSVTVLDNWGNGGKDFTRTIPFDKLTAVKTKAEVDAARAAGLVVGETPRGFALADAGVEPPPPSERPEDELYGATAIDAMRQSLKVGVKVVVASQLFPTPLRVASQMVELAGIESGHRVLEPSAGTGVLLGAMGCLMFGEDVKYGRVHAVEINGVLCPILRADFPLAVIHQGDFLQMSADDFGGAFDRVLMNPPFERGSDIKHIEHALTMLAPGGRLVAACAAGPRQHERFKDRGDTDWIDLPDGTFAEQGTNVRTAIVVIDKSEPDQGFEAFCQEENEL